MEYLERTITCRDLADYTRSHRIQPFTVGQFTFNYESNEMDRQILDRIIAEGRTLAEQVNPAAANDATIRRTNARLLNNSVAGLLAEYCWKSHLNDSAGQEVVRETEFQAANGQIDLQVINSGARIEVRSSFPRNGIQFAICSQWHQFDILGPYVNAVKPGEVAKEYYVRTLYHVRKGESFMDLVVQDGFRAFITGGATWGMMTNPDIYINKDLKPEDVIANHAAEFSQYRVVPFSRALDTPQITDLIINDGA